MRMFAGLVSAGGAVVLVVSPGFPAKALSPDGNGSAGGGQEKHDGSRNHVWESGKSLVRRRIHCDASKSRSPVIAGSHSHDELRGRAAVRSQSNPVAALNRVSQPGQDALEQSHHDISRNRAVTGSPAVANEACAIQLSESFRLPAVIMARAMSVGGETSDHGSPRIQEAMDGMIDRFYRDVASSPDSLETPPVDTVGNASPDTKVILPGPGSGLVTSHSNEQFRSLFGTEAYNRFSINSAVEVTLPPVESE